MIVTDETVIEEMRDEAVNARAVLREMRIDAVARGDIGMIEIGIDMIDRGIGIESGTGIGIGIAGGIETEIGTVIADADETTPKAPLLPATNARVNVRAQIWTSTTPPKPKPPPTTLLIPPYPPTPPTHPLLMVQRKKSA